MKKDKPKLFRFTPEQLKQFHSIRRRFPDPVCPGDDVPHIVFPKGTRFVADFSMTHEEIQAVSDLMFAGQKFKEALERLKKTLGEETSCRLSEDWSTLYLNKEGGGE